MIDTAATTWRRTARAVVLGAAPALAIAAAAAGCGGSSGSAAGSGAPATVTVVVHHHGAGGQRSGHAAARGHGSNGRGRQPRSSDGGSDAGSAGASRMSGAGGATRTTGADGATRTTSAAGETRTTATGAAAASARTPADAAAPTQRAASNARPTAVAVVTRRVAMRSAPGRRGHVLGRLGARTQFGSTTAVPVVRRHGAWLGVTSLLAGNNRLGWIPRSAVSLSRNAWRIYVSLDRQRITVSYGNRIVRRLRTSTGVAGASTPTGRFAVTDRLRTGVQDGPYGCCILALSAVQPLHLSEWDGGDRIAIHATVDVADLGRPASHGCAHVDDADGHWLLEHIPDGTPVVISRPPFDPRRGAPA